MHICIHDIHIDIHMDPIVVKDVTQGFIYVNVCDFYILRMLLFRQSTNQIRTNQCCAGTCKHPSFSLVSSHVASLILAKIRAKTTRQ